MFTEFQTESFTGLEVFLQPQLLPSGGPQIDCRFSTLLYQLHFTDSEATSMFFTKISSAGNLMSLLKLYRVLQIGGVAVYPGVFAVRSELFALNKPYQ